jgi:sec-independent protein translocase protein TatA
MPFQLGIPEVILVLLVALLFLGPKRLPEAGRSLGRGIREFKDGISGHDEGSGANTDSSTSRAAALNPPQPTYTPPQAYTPPPAYVPHRDQSPPASE